MTPKHTHTSRPGLGTLLALAVAGAPAALAQTSESGSTAGAQAKQAELVRGATALVGEQSGADADNRAPAEIRAAARCVAVFPDVLKAGFVVAAQGGQGLVSCRVAGTERWGAPAFYNINAASVGLQAGYERTSFVMLFLTEEAVASLRKPKTKFGAGMSVAAGEVGAGAKLDAETAVVSYSRSKGLFAGIDLSGATLVYDKDATSAAYGTTLGVAQVLSGEREVPGSLAPFVEALERYASPAGS